MPFSDPGTQVQVTNTISLTSATATLLAQANTLSGAKLVDPSPNYQQASAGVPNSPGFVMGTVNSGGAISFSMNISLPAGALVGDSIAIDLNWSSPSSVITATQRYELPLRQGSISNYYIVDRCLDANAQFVLAEINGTATLQGNLVCTIGFSNRPADRPRITADDGGDGLIMLQTAAIGIGVTTAILVGRTGIGQINYRFAASSSAMTFNPGWGKPFGINWKIGVASNAEFLGQVLTMNRPFACKVTNTGGVAGNYFIHAWQAGD